jgi:hypothetical protein
MQKREDKKGALNNEFAEKDLQDYKNGTCQLTQEELAAKYNVTQGAISSALNRMTVRKPVRLDIYMLMKAYDNLNEQQKFQFRHYVFWDDQYRKQMDNLKEDWT